MFLPNRNQAYIPSLKLSAYLLSATHAVGKSKANFLRTFGSDGTNPALLEQELLKIAQTEMVQETVLSPYGTKYVTEGLLDTPSGHSILVRTIWIVEIGEDRPRFVTAYPA